MHNEDLNGKNALLLESINLTQNNVKKVISVNNILIGK